MSIYDVTNHRASECDYNIILRKRNSIDEQRRRERNKSPRRFRDCQFFCNRKPYLGCF